MKKEPGFILLLFSTANQILYPSTWKGIEENDILLSFWSWPHAGLSGSCPLSPRGSRKRKVKVSVIQSWPTLCNPMHGIPPGSSVHGILQARTLEWVAISFSRADPGLRPGSPDCRQILYSLSHQQSQKKPEAEGTSWSMLCSFSAVTHGCFEGPNGRKWKTFENHNPCETCSYRH